MRGQEIVGTVAMNLLDSIETEATDPTGQELRVRDVVVLVLVTSGLDDNDQVIDRENPGISDVYVGSSNRVRVYQRGIIERALDIVRRDDVRGI